VGGYAPVGRNGHHIPQTVAADHRPQVRVGAIDFIAGDPCGGDTRGHRAVDQCGGQCGFGRKNLLGVRDSRRCAAVMIISPGPWWVQCPVDQGVPARGGVGQIHRHLGVLNPARGTTVLALHPDRMSAFLDVAGLIDLCRRRHRSTYTDPGTMPRRRPRETERVVVVA